LGADGEFVAVRFIGGFDVDVVVRHQYGRALTLKLRRFEGDVAFAVGAASRVADRSCRCGIAIHSRGNERDIAASFQCGAKYGFVVFAFLSDAGIVAEGGTVFGCLQVDVAAGLQGEVFACVDLGCGHLQVVTRLHVKIAADVDLAGLVCDGVDVGVIGTGVFLLSGDGADGDVFCGIQAGVASGLEVCGDDGDVASGDDVQAVRGGYAVSSPVPYCCCPQR